MENDIKKPTGRPYGQEVRIHKTYWVSEEEHQFISSYLRQRRQKASKTGTPGRDRFKEKKERIRVQEECKKRYDKRQEKLLRELAELNRLKEED